jgi:hypothetical protein
MPDLDRNFVQVVLDRRADLRRFARGYLPHDLGDLLTKLMSRDLDDLLQLGPPLLLVLLLVPCLHDILAQVDSDIPREPEADDIPDGSHYGLANAL